VHFDFVDEHPADSTQTRGIHERFVGRESLSFRVRAGGGQPTRQAYPPYNFCCTSTLKV
jgi:hypothetical protein